ncbi:hypothetical protein SAMN05660916_00853 [Arthrobacter sp. 31Cvi3.1E]|uniref:hypothetical protein n=1 Tax=Paenarthrobacter nicotinovorans TaxID=29320 RepID=UPI0009CBC7DC|nr:hypothetical protein [Paenarthrobacter nicotinovorans]SKB42247.1 hypothetical protein SAMN05660916_00853 [Arthrobacter sp. 31Cvi3.1E]
MTSKGSIPSRRFVLRSALGAATYLGLSVVLSPAAEAQEHESNKTSNDDKSKKSANGWSVVSTANEAAGVWTRTVPGSAASLAVRVGDPETILVHVARRYNYEIRSLGDRDVEGFVPLDQLPSGVSSNLASGTAMRILPGSFTLGFSGGFYGSEMQILRSILAECEGVVAWGGDARVVDEALFEIVCGPRDKRVSHIADKIRSWSERPGVGAGTVSVGV